MAPSIEIATTDIVVVGNVDFKSISAAWLREEGLTRPSEADPAAVEELDGDREYSLKGGAFQLKATKNRLAVQSSLGNAPIVKDLVMGLLLLDRVKAPRAIGLNFHGHYKCESEAQWHKIGDTLVPKPMWQEIFPNYHPGMQTVQVRLETVDSQDRVEVTVQPSARFPNGVYMVWNDHSAAPKDVDAKWAVEVIRAKFDEACIGSFAKFEEILSKCI